MFDLLNLLRKIGKRPLHVLHLVPISRRGYTQQGKSSSLTLPRARHHPKTMLNSVQALVSRPSPPFLISSIQITSINLYKTLQEVFDPKIGCEVASKRFRTVRANEPCTSCMTRVVEMTSDIPALPLRLEGSSGRG
jgi:hypothetical protein